MTKVYTCLAGRRLQQPTPPLPECKEGEERLAKFFETLRTTLGNVDLTTSLVTSANGVVITNDDVTSDDLVAAVTRENESVNTLEKDCGYKKLMEWPVAAGGRRLQKPTPKIDQVCQKQLADLLDIRRQKVFNFQG